MAGKRFFVYIVAAFMYSVVLISMGCRHKSEDENPKLTTLKETRLGSSIAYSGGTVTSSNDRIISLRGVCWSDRANPTISDHKTEDGSGPGNFKSTLYGLTPNTTYYVRMYAILNGSEQYGDLISFRTKDVVTDIDGNVYNTVTIGKQVWMVENLRTTRYQNGDLIPTTTPSNLDIKNTKDPKYQWACHSDDRIVKKYGRIYTWYVAVDPRKVCPVGWHVPSDDEWTELQNYLIQNRYNYDELTHFNEIAKSLTAPIGWGYSSIKGTPGNTDFPQSTNKSGFSALPAGYRDLDGVMGKFGNIGAWWSSTEESNYQAYYRYIHFNRNDLIRSNNLEFCGVSIRCVKDY